MSLIDEFSCNKEDTEQLMMVEMAEGSTETWQNMEQVTLSTSDEY